MFESFVEANREICVVGKPASDELIRLAENFLELTFPRDYRDFLRSLGTLSVGPLEFLGITGPEFLDSSIPNGIWFTAKKRLQLRLPHHFVVSLNNEDVEYYCIDTSAVAISRVVVWNVVSREVTATKSDSLFDCVLTESRDFV